MNREALTVGREGPGWFAGVLWVVVGCRECSRVAGLSRAP
jgi:hypothetical protein